MVIAARYVRFERPLGDGRARLERRFAPERRLYATALSVFVRRACVCVPIPEDHFF